jgi:NADPH-dependent ferric siderophore reductase
MTFVSAAVVETSRLSTHFYRVVFHLPDLGALLLPTGPDTSIGVFFAESGSAPSRTYTVREIDPTIGAITIDFLVHGDGVGTSWVRRTARGDKVTIAYPGSWYTIRPETGPQLLVADLAGLPALARIIETLPRDADAAVIVEVLDENDLDYLPQRPDIEVVASVGSGNGVAASALAHLVRKRCAAIEPGYCWFAGEASEARAVRRYLRRELHWAVARFDVMGYWRMNSQDWDRRYAAVGAELFLAYQNAMTDGVDQRLAAEEFDLALEREGL